MLNEENKKLCWEILTKYGIQNQQHMVIEECSELQKAICKLYRAKTQEEYNEFYRNFIEELLDVIAVCQQMLLSENVSMDKVNDFIKAKLIIALERAERNERG